MATTYQLADAVNGKFGWIYGTYEDAQAALGEEMDNHLDAQIEQLEIEDEMQGMGRFEEPKEYTREEMEARARARMAGFLTIVEV